MDHVTGLKCTVCGEVYRPDEVEYVCPTDGGNLDVQYDYNRIAEQVAQAGWPHLGGVWRYKPLMPIEADAPIPPLMVNPLLQT